jgi:hypothetical protein
MCGDSANATDVAGLMAGKTAKLCATDLPYLVSYDGKNHPSKNFSDGKNKDWKGGYADKQKSEPLGPFYEAFLRQALAVCEADAAIYVWHASQRQMEVEKAMRDCGILVHKKIIWVKNKPVLTHSSYMWQHEPCFFGWKQGNKPTKCYGAIALIGNNSKPLSIPTCGTSSGIDLGSALSSMLGSLVCHIDPSPPNRTCSEQIFHLSDLSWHVDSFGAETFSDRRLRNLGVIETRSCAGCYRRRDPRQAARWAAKWCM